MRRLLSIVLAGVLLPGLAAAEVYRWVDENGKVHFGDRPPASARPAPVDVKSAPASAPAAPSVDRADKQRRLLEMYENERQRKAKQKQDVERAERRQAQNCRRARNIWYRYTRSGALYDEDAKGNRRYLDKTERRQEEERARTAVKRFCGEDPRQVKSESR